MIEWGKDLQNKKCKKIPHDFNNAALFRALEEKKNNQTFAEQNGIRAYGIAMTTLEQVFLDLGITTFIFIQKYFTKSVQYFRMTPSFLSGKD